MVKGKFKVIEIRQREKAEILLLEFIQNPNGDRFDELPSEILGKGDEYYVMFVPVEPDPVPEFNQ